MPPPITSTGCGGSGGSPIISSSTCRRRIRRGCATCNGATSSTALVLRALVAAAIAAAAPGTPLLVKIAPDLNDAERADIAALAGPSGIDGIVIANTTVARPEGLKSRQAGEAGGLSRLAALPQATTSRAAGRNLSTDRRQTPADRGRRHRQRRRRLRQDPRRRLAGAALHRAGVRGSGADRPDQARAGRFTAPRRFCLDRRGRRG